MSGAIETQSHILYCEAYSALREGKSLSSDKDIVVYFRKVIEIGDKLGIEWSMLLGGVPKPSGPLHTEMLWQEMSLDGVP